MAGWEVHPTDVFCHDFWEKTLHLFSFCHPNKNQAWGASHTGEVNGNTNRLCFIKEQTFMCSFATAKPSAWYLNCFKKSPTNQACRLLPVYLWAFLGLPCRWPHIISSTYSVGHSSWSLSLVCQMSWFRNRFWVSLVNFVLHLEERVQKRDSGNLSFKPWKMVSCHGLMLSNGWCKQHFIKSIARAHFEKLNESSAAVHNMLGPITGAVSRLFLASMGRSFIPDPCVEKLFVCTSGKVDQGDFWC